MNFTEVFGKANWIGTGNDADIPLIFQRFEARRGEAAEITVLGFGVFILYINGVRVHREECLPLSSDFEANDFPSGEKLNHRAYVEKFDISPYLVDGENMLSILLGNGWYNKPIWEESFGDGNKKAAYRIVFADGREVVSSTEAKWVPSRVTDNHYNKGEVWDMRIDDEAAKLPGYNGEERPVVVEASLRESRLDTSDCPRDVIHRTLPVKPVYTCDEYTIYDIGINTTGYPHVEVAAECGEKVEILFSEDITKDGTDIDEKHAHEQKFNLISDGKGRTVRPLFGWICARYARVKGNAKVVAFDEMYSDVRANAAFTSDNPVLNYIFDVFMHTQLINMHTGMPSDCPQIERRGYTGDGQLVAHAAMMSVDSEKFYRKWLIDISDCQDRISGHVQYTAPYTHSGGGPGGWGCAMVTVPLEFYERFGDIKPMQTMYPQMWEYLRYLDEHSANGIVVTDRAGEWCLGDWVTPDPVALPAPFVNNYFYVKSCQKMIKIAKLLGKEEDIPELERRIAERSQANVYAYFNPWDGNFIGGVQAANAFAVDIGIGDKRTLEKLIERYESLGYYDTGIFGTEIVTRLMFELGRPDIAVRLMTADTPHGFGRFKNEGRTTLPEYWGTRSRSLCHPMFGAVAAHLFDYILGIRQAEGSTGYDRVVIKPLALDVVKNASGHLTAKCGGQIAVDIKDGKTVTVTIPEGVSGVFVNGDKTTELAVGENVFTV